VVISQSHNVHKAVAFEPLAPAALFLRILITFVVIKVGPRLNLWIYPGQHDHEVTEARGYRCKRHVHA